MGLWTYRLKKDRNALSASQDVSPDPQSLTILITGSTGNFGSYLLDHLIAQPWVDHIVCLNRSANAHDRQLKAHEERGLTTNFENVSFYQADFGHEHFGLIEQTYQHLASKVDLVIHNAWPLDFNRNFRSFESSINGVQHFINFCMSRAEQPVKLLFVSSIGATSNWGSAAPS